MAEDLLVRLKAVDPAILTDVVRQDQRSPSFEITEWSVKLLSSQGAINPDGLWLFSGEGCDSRGSAALGGGAEGLPPSGARAATQ